MTREELINKLKKQEELLVFDTFTRDTALELGSMIIATAKEKEVDIAVEIIINGLAVYKHSMEGMTGRNDIWLKRKANSVKFSLNSSWLFGEALADIGKTIDKDLYLSFEEYAILAGGFPLKIRGVGTVGSICVSGLFHTDDHDLIIEVLSKMLNVQL